MRLASICFLAVSVLACGSALAQQANNKPSATLAYEDGRFQNNLYSNECFGFSLAVPYDWIPSEPVDSGEVRATHISEGNLILLSLEQTNENASFKNSIVIEARVAIPSDMTAQEFVSNAVHAQIDLTDVQRHDLLGDAYRVEYGGRDFFRADYKSSMKRSDVYRPLYHALVYTKFRDYFIGASLLAHSREGLDESANVLADISFSEDERNLKCGMSWGANRISGGILTGVISSKPTHPNPGQRVRVSTGVSTGLLVTKVTPQYPDEAKQAHVQGLVTLQGEIDKNGNIEGLTLVSGHPMLAPAAIEAVTQWKYKPYLLAGEPVAVETQIVVNFQLSGR
jgi:TonB family protein